MQVIENFYRKNNNLSNELLSQTIKLIYKKAPDYQVSTKRKDTYLYIFLKKNDEIIYKFKYSKREKKFEKTTIFDSNIKYKVEINRPSNIFITTKNKTIKHNLIKKDHIESMSSLGHNSSICISGIKKQNITFDQKTNNIISFHNEIKFSYIKAEKIDLRSCVADFERNIVLAKLIHFPSYNFRNLIIRNNFSASIILKEKINSDEVDLILKIKNLTLIIFNQFENEEVLNQIVNNNNITVICKSVNKIFNPRKKVLKIIRS